MNPTGKRTISGNTYKINFFNQLNGEIQYIYLTGKSEYHVIKRLNNKFLCPIILSVFLINGKKEIKVII